LGEKLQNLKAPLERPSLSIKNQISKLLHAVRLYTIFNRTTFTD